MGSGLGSGLGSGIGSSWTPKVGSKKWGRMGYFSDLKIWGPKLGSDGVFFLIENLVKILIENLIENLVKILGSNWGTFLDLKSGS